MQESADVGLDRVVGESANGNGGQHGLAGILNGEIPTSRAKNAREMGHPADGCVTAPENAKTQRDIRKIGACYRSDQERVQGEPPGCRLDERSPPSRSLL